MDITWRQSWHCCEGVEGRVVEDVVQEEGLLIGDFGDGDDEGVVAGREVGVVEEVVGLISVWVVLPV